MTWLVCFVGIRVRSNLVGSEVRLSTRSKEYMVVKIFVAVVCCYFRRNHLARIHLYFEILKEILKSDSENEVVGFDATFASLETTYGVHLSLPSFEYYDSRSKTIDARPAGTVGPNMNTRELADGQTEAKPMEVDIVVKDRVR